MPHCLDLGNIPFIATKRRYRTASQFGTVKSMFIKYIYIYNINTHMFIIHEYTVLYKRSNICLGAPAQQVQRICRMVFLM